MNNDTISRLRSWWEGHPKLLQSDLMEANTGVSITVFNICFCKYGGKHTLIPYPDNLFYLLQYLKNNNVVRTLRSSDGSQLASSGGWSLIRIKETCAYLASVVDEVDECWLQRRRADNILPDTFSDRVLGCVDTTPIVIDNAMSSAFYNGKYKQHVLKVQVVCDHRGRVLYYSGPHVGTIHD